MTTPTSGSEQQGRSARYDLDPALELLAETADHSPAAAAHTTGSHSGPGLAHRAEAEHEHVKSTGKPPSPTWYGGTAIGLIFVMAVILLTYTLLDWEWQQNIGWWNYIAVILLIPFVSVMMRLWRPDDSI